MIVSVGGFDCEYNGIIFFADIEQKANIVIRKLW